MTSVATGPTRLFVIVLVKKDALRDIEGSVSELLAPHDEKEGNALFTTKPKEVTA